MADYTYKTVNGQRFRSTTNVVQRTDIVGMDELIRDLLAFADDAMPELIDVSEQAANIVLVRAKHKVPVDTGTLRDSLKVVKPRTKKGTYIAMSRVTFGKDASYAVRVELGHDTRAKGMKRKHVEERPFLRPAADESKDTVQDMIIRAMNKLIDEKLGD